MMIKRRHVEILRNAFSELPRFVLWMTCYTVIWCILTGMDLSGWMIGLVGVGFAAWINVRFIPRSSHSLNLSGLPGFGVFFLCQSFLSGLDVMRRTLSVRLKIDPGLILYTTFLPEGPARIFLVNTISMLPGTLSADLDDNVITIHTLDRNMPVWGNVLNLEARISTLFGVAADRGKKS